MAYTPSVGDANVDDPYCRMVFRESVAAHWMACTVDTGFHHHRKSAILWRHKQNARRTVAGIEISDI